jgi:pSer/pThr/pTyr-binding forkhead associated (FHA) protein
MQARLFCKTGQLAGANYTIADEATIGKGPENSIQLYPSVISTRHARISFDRKANAFFIEDLRSRNGTKVDGMKVVGKEKLSKLHIITFAGQFDFIFQVGTGEVHVAIPPPPKKVQPAAQPSAQQSLAKDASPERKTVVDAGFDMMPKLEEASKLVPEDVVGKTVVGDDFVSLPRISPTTSEKVPAPPLPKPAPVEAGSKTVISDGFFPLPGSPFSLAKPPEQKLEESEPTLSVEFLLEFKDLPEGSKSFKLKEGENTIGRESGCGIQIEDGSLSRKHATLVVSGGVVMLKDLGSKNHTFLEDQKLNYEVEIRDGANLIFGMVKATLVRNSD